MGSIDRSQPRTTGNGAHFGVERRPACLARSRCGAHPALPKSTPDSPVDERLLGYMAWEKATSYRCGTRHQARSIYRRCGRPIHFEAANDMLARRPNTSAAVEFNLLYEFHDGRRSASIAEHLTRGR
jgi:hypothetical protein